VRTKRAGTDEGVSDHLCNDRRRTKRAGTDEGVSDHLCTDRRRIRDLIQTVLFVLVIVKSNLCLHTF
jgi:hypothetical protein